MSMMSPEAIDIGAQQVREGPAMVGGVAVRRLCGDRAVVIELERIVPVIGDRAVYLLCGSRHRRDGVAAFRLREGHLPGARRAFAERCARLPGQQSAELEVAIHVGAMVLHGLKAADWLAELDARSRIVERQIERGVADAD